MSECPHEHKVCETHWRTLAKGITAKAAEVSFDLLIFDAVLSTIVPQYGLINNTMSALGIAVIVESVCFGLNYINERFWNRIQWGRKITEIPTKKEYIDPCTQCDEYCGYCPLFHMSREERIKVFYHLEKEK